MTDPVTPLPGATSHHVLNPKHSRLGHLLARLMLIQGSQMGFLTTLRYKTSPNVSTFP